MNREDIMCPGETIKELLEIYHYNQQNLADKLNMDLKTINEILNGKAPITVETAMKLEMIFNVDASFWNNLEFNYRKQIKQIEQKEIIEQEYEIVKKVYKEMVQRKIVEDTKEKCKVVESFKKFMEVTSLENLKSEYYEVACRQANIKGFNYVNLMVWIQIGLKRAREIEVKDYSRDKILDKIQEIRYLTLLRDQNKARKELIKICNECGIIVIFEKSMPNTAIYGIAKWLNSKTPYIQISDRGKNESTFWFSFMHELGHIVNGKKKKIFIDTEDKVVDEDENIQLLKECEEIKADNFARNALLPDKNYKIFFERIKDNKIKFSDITNFAKEMSVAPYIVAGRLKYDLNKYNDKTLNYFNVKMEF